MISIVTLFIYSDNSLITFEKIRIIKIQTVDTIFLKQGVSLLYQENVDKHIILLINGLRRHGCKQHKLIANIQGD